MDPCDAAGEGGALVRHRRQHGEAGAVQPVPRRARAVQPGHRSGCSGTTSTTLTLTCCRPGRPGLADDVFGGVPVATAPRGSSAVAEQGLDAHAGGDVYGRRRRGGWRRTRWCGTGTLRTPPRRWRRVRRGRPSLVKMRCACTSTVRSRGPVAGRPGWSALPMARDTLAPALRHEPGGSPWGDQLGDEAGPRTAGHHPVHSVHQRGRGSSTRSLSR